MVEMGDRARDEFFSESQEILESFSQTLLNIERTLKTEEPNTELVNNAFREVHTLKGLAGLFGAEKLSRISRSLEDVLDHLRLGRLDLSFKILDILFGAVDLATRILECEKGNIPEVHDPRNIFNELEKLAEQTGTPSTSFGDFALDPSVLSVLTEYEEHRLRTSIAQGSALFKLRVACELMTLDKRLDAVKERAKQFGEILTYLPTGTAADPNTIELDILMASKEPLEALEQGFADANVDIEAVPRRTATSAAFAHAAPALERARHDSLMSADGSTTLDQQGGSLRSLTQTVRVDIRKLDHLMNIVGELGIVRGMLARIAERLKKDGQRQLGSELSRVHRSFERRLSEMQEGILEVRMVPLSQVFDRLTRVVRQIGRELGKEIRLVVTGAETEIDKLIVEELSDPLMHIVRNAIDHGIENSEEREKAGKPRAGTIALNAFQKGNHVVIEIEDDGRGIDQSRIVKRAIELGKLSPDEAHELSRAEALALIFLPGFSTRTEATDVSGRGVGMDVVKTNIYKIGGMVDVESELGIGTKLTITLPITLAIVRALLVIVGEHTYAIPLASVSEVVVFADQAVRQLDGREVTTLRGSTIAFCRLWQQFNLNTPVAAGGKHFAVVVNLGQRRLALVVDEFLGQQDIVIKPLGKSLSSVRGFAGATDLGDQRVGLVIDPGAIIDEVLATNETSRERARASA